MTETERADEYIRCWYGIEAALRAAMPNHKLRDLAYAVTDLAHERDLYRRTIQLYARHQADCSEIITGEPCDCGWLEVRGEISELNQPCEEELNGNAEGSY